MEQQTNYAKYVSPLYEHYLLGAHNVEILLKHKMFVYVLWHHNAASDVACPLSAYTVPIYVILFISIYIYFMYSLFIYYFLYLYVYLYTFLIYVILKLDI